jgi:hypothetical protein
MWGRRAAIGAQITQRHHLPFKVTNGIAAGSMGDEAYLSG